MGRSRSAVGQARFPHPLGSVRSAVPHNRSVATRLAWATKPAVILRVLERTPRSGVRCASRYGNDRCDNILNCAAAPLVPLFICVTGGSNKDTGWAWAHDMCNGFSISLTISLLPCSSIPPSLYVALCRRRRRRASCWLACPSHPADHAGWLVSHMHPMIASAHAARKPQPTTTSTPVQFSDRRCRHRTCRQAQHQITVRSIF